MPEPMTPPDCDLRGLPFMPLDVVRLGDSDLVALSTGDEFKAAVILWCKSWLQVPAASLPDDDRVLAHLTGLGPRWKKVRAMALHGWIKCDDGRLYHPVIAEKAVDAWERRGEWQEKQNNKTERQQRWRARLKEISAELRELGVTPPTNAPLSTMERLLVDARASTSRSTVDARETALTGTGTGTVIPLPTGNGADPEKVMFDSGVTLLGGAGKSEHQARTLLGRWKRDHGVEAVIAALGRAQREGAIEPVAFIEGCLKAKARNQTYDPERITV